MTDVKTQVNYGCDKILQESPLDSALRSCTIRETIRHTKCVEYIYTHIQVCNISGYISQLCLYKVGVKQTLQVGVK